MTSSIENPSFKIDYDKNSNDYTLVELVCEVRQVDNGRPATAGVPEIAPSIRFHKRTASIPFSPNALDKDLFMSTIIGIRNACSPNALGVDANDAIEASRQRQQVSMSCSYLYRPSYQPTRTLSPIHNPVQRISRSFSR